MTENERKGPRRALVVDDHRPMRILLEHRLQREGWEATVVEDGETAWACLGEGNFDLIFMDLGLPGLSGLELLERIRTQLSTDLPVCVLSGSEMGATQERCQELGVWAFIRKPFEVKEITAVLEQVARVSPSRLEERKEGP